MRDQCPHCFKKFEQDAWINRTGCPYCGKRIIIDVFEKKDDDDDSPEENYFATLPKVPPRLDWALIPFAVIVFMPWPAVRSMVRGFDPQTFEITPTDGPTLVAHTGIAALCGLLGGYVYFRKHRAAEGDDMATRRLRLATAAASILILVGYFAW